MKKIILLIAAALLAVSTLTAQDRIINRYGLDLARVKGGYRLMDENNIASKGLFDLSKVPADMYEPYYRSRTFLKDEDFHQCETVEMVFVNYPGYELKLAIDLPKEREGKALPFIIWIHGGGWHTGNFGGHSLQSRYLAGHGIAGVRISYSLLTQGAYFSDTWNDIQAALAFVKAHAAEYNLDPGRFGFAGHSAGGHLAAYAAMRIPETKLLISLNGIYDLVNTYPGYVPSNRNDDYFNLASEEARKNASPVTFVHPGAPYCLLTFTGGDTLVDKDQVKTFTRALRANGVKYDLIYKDYYSHNGFNDTDLFEPMLMKILITAQKYL